MNWVIKIVGKLFSVDGINVLHVDTEQYSVSCSNIWDVNKQVDEHRYDCMIEYEEILWLMNQLMGNEFLYIPDVEKLPQSAVNIWKRRNERHVRALAAFPIAEKAHTLTILQSVSVTAEKTWDDEELRVYK